MLNTLVEMVDLLKRDRKHKLNDSKDEDIYVDYRFMFESVACVERC